MLFKILNLSLILILLFILTNCTSLPKKEAIELMDKGLYEEAYQKWQVANQEDPHDHEVLVGLQKAKEHIVNDGLIRVRNLRTGNQFDQALETLNTIYKGEKEWSFQLDANSATFQKNETERIWNYFKQKFDGKSNSPLMLAYTHKTYFDLFAESKQMELEKIKIKIVSQGSDSCTPLKKEVTHDRPYFASFVFSYCSYFNRKDINFGVIDKEKLSFFEIVINDNVNSFTNRERQIFDKKIETYFKQTPWYSAEGKKSLIIPMNGVWALNESRQIVPQTHIYYVDEPYVVYVQKQKDFYGPTPSAPSSTDQNQMQKQDVQHYITTEPETRYRKVQKSYHYTGTVTTRSIKLDVDISTTPLQKELKTSISDEQSESVMNHNYNVPEIELFPSHTELKNVDIWIEERAEKLAQNMEKELNQEWKDLFCTLPKERSLSQYGDRVIQCKKLKTPDTNSFANQWFTDNFGVTYDQAVSVLGQF